MFTPDRGHVHHVLLDAGISHRRVVVGLYCICCILCSVALVVVLHRKRDIGYMLLTASIFGCIFWGVSVKRQLLGVLSKKSAGPDQS